MKNFCCVTLTAFCFYILTSQFCLGMGDIENTEKECIKKLIECLPLEEGEKKYIESSLKCIKNKNEGEEFFIPLCSELYRGVLKESPLDAHLKIRLKISEKKGIFFLPSKKKRSIEFEGIYLLRGVFLDNLSLIFPLNQFPEILCFQKNLTGLDLDGHELTGLPESFSQLTNLMRLGLSRNPLKIFPLVITLLPNLENLSVSGTELKELPEELCRLTNLTRLSACQNDLIGLPKGIGSMKSLNVIAVDSKEGLMVPETLVDCINLDILAFIQSIMLRSIPGESRLYSSENVVEFFKFPKKFAHEIFLYVLAFDELGEMRDVNLNILNNLFQLYCKDNPFLTKYYMCLIPTKSEIYFGKNGDRPSSV